MQSLFLLPDRTSEKINWRGFYAVLDRSSFAFYKNQISFPAL